MVITVKVENLDKILDAIKKMPEVTVREASIAVQRSIMTLNNQAIKEAPANKEIGQGTRLRHSFKTRMSSKLSGELFSISPYADYVHEGTAPHVIEAKNKRVLANRRTGAIFGRRVNHPGTRANRFFVRSLETSKKKIDEYFQKALDTIVKTFPR